MKKKKEEKRIKKEKTLQTAEAAKLKSTRHKQSLVFHILMILIPVIFFAALECTLSLFHYGGHLKLVQEFSTNPVFYQLNSGIGKKYFPRHKFTTQISSDLFYKEKKKDSYRIFVLGGSSAAGYPYMNNGAFSRMLRTRLQAQFPDRFIETINAAMPAVNSFTILDFVNELVHFQPDVLLIYAGHNEFYGALGAGSTESLGKSRTVIKLFLKLQNYRTFLLIRNLVMSAKQLFRSGAELSMQDDITVMERMVGQQEIAYQSDTYVRALEFFRSNLNEIIAISKKYNVDIIISELVSNVRDQKPFVSIFSNEPEKNKWRQIVNQGFEKQQQKQFQFALDHYYKAKSIDNSPALLYYLIAQCYDRLAQYDSAKTNYYQSKDLDGLRFRASEDFNNAIRDVCKQNNIPCVPLLQEFERYSANELIGDNLILDHLHPNVNGYFLIAKSFADIMQKHHLIHPDWHPEQTPSDSLLLTQMGLTELDYKYAQLAVNILKAGWPFKPKGTANKVIHAKPKTDMEKIVRKWLFNEYNWEQVHVLMAEYHKRNNDLDKAADEYFALILGTPYNEFPYLKLAEIKIAEKQYNQALKWLEPSLKVAETAYANKWIGVIRLNIGQSKEAIFYLDRAHKLEPSDQQTTCALSLAFKMNGDYEIARSMIKKLADKNPDYPGLQEYMRELNQILDVK